MPNWKLWKKIRKRGKVLSRKSKQDIGKKRKISIRLTVTSNSDQDSKTNKQ